MATARLPEAKSVTREHGHKVLDDAAKKHLGMSGEEFTAKWDAGAFNGDADSRAVMRVAMLLPLGR